MNWLKSMATILSDARFGTGRIEPRSRSSKTDGFTLLEIFIVITILSVLTAAAVSTDRMVITMMISRRVKPSVFEDLDRGSIRPVPKRASLRIVAIDFNQFIAKRYRTST